jgi:excisionase family DNA binding protein
MSKAATMSATQATPGGDITLEQIPPGEIPQALLTVNQFCRRHEIGRTKFYELLRSGMLRAKKIGRKTVILAADELAWLASLPDYKPHVDRGS